MKILFISDAYIPFPSGVAVTMETLRYSLEKLGHKVYIIATESGKWTDKNGSIIRLPGIYSAKHKPIAWPTKKLPIDIFKKLNIDIINSHFYHQVYDYPVELANKLDLPLVDTVHRIFPEIEKRTHRLLSSPERRFSSSAKKTLAYYNKCTKIISPSASSANYLSSLSLRTDISIIPTGIFIKDFTSYPPQLIKERFKIPQERKIILAVSSIDKISNIPFLIKGFKQIWKAIDNVHLLIVGEGDYSQQYQKAINDLPYRDFITLPGYLPKKTLNKVYGAADLLVNVNQLDPQPLPIVEALAAGTPVVTLKGLGGQDFVTNNRNGFVAANKEDFITKTVEILRRDTLLKEFSKAARHSATAFMASNLTQNLIELFESEIEKHKNE